MYDRIHYFRIRPNPKPKPKIHRVHTESESESWPQILVCASDHTTEIIPFRSLKIFSSKFKYVAPTNFQIACFKTTLGKFAISDLKGIISVVWSEAQTNI